MSWLESLRSDSFGGRGGVEDFSGVSSDATARSSDAWEGEEELIDQGSPRRRVKEDLSDFTKAISSKFWGVASFLTPSPSSQTSSSLSSSPLRRQQQEPTISGESEVVVSYESSRTAGLRSDFAEIGGTLKTGIARLSNNVSINGISMIASAILPLREEDEEEEDDEIEEREEYEDEHVSDVIGVTDEVLAFAKNIACHPETWLDFPLLSDDEDFDDFDMSVAQHDHALVIESLAPRLAALRIELCPTHISIGYFWKIYFALLHPRLNKHDADLLSTPQIVEARAMLQQGLHSHSKQESEEAEFVDKFVVNEESSYLQTKFNEMSLRTLNDEDDDDDDWPEDETQDQNPTSRAALPAAFLIFNEEDISFSDLEDDNYLNFSKTSKSAAASLNLISRSTRNI